MQGQTLEAAAAAAGMSERTARTWQDGPMPSATKTTRTWRTRPDPFAAVWATEIEPFLRRDEGSELQATALMDELCRRHSGEFEPGQVRTLQRQIRRWRAMHGPEQEVMFPQDHQPGQLGAFDFTHCQELGVTIAGVIFVHLMFQFVLAWSGWHYISIALGETYEALLTGVQGALWELGGVPARVRQDNLSAATHELVETGGRTLTKRYAEVVEHYGFEASRIEPGEAHQNGVVEKAHDLLKTALRQALILRGSREFPTVEAYLAFARAVVDEHFHRHRAEEIAQERDDAEPSQTAKDRRYAVRRSLGSALGSLAANVPAHGLFCDIRRFDLRRGQPSAEACGEPQQIHGGERRVAAFEKIAPDPGQVAFERSRRLHA